MTRLFAGRSWREGAETAGAMCEAFRVLRRVHELVLLLQQAQRLPLSEGERGRCAALLERLEADHWGLTPGAFVRAGIEAEVMSFLASLRACVTR